MDEDYFLPYKFCHTSIKRSRIRSYTRVDPLYLALLDDG
jgi:hypothetical protein